MFRITLINVAILLIYMIPGFVLGKLKKASIDHLPTLSAILLYVMSPFLCVSAFLSLGDFDVDVLKNMGLFFILIMVFTILFMGGLFFIFRKKYDISKYRILTVGSVVGNVGFFGLPIIKAMYPLNPEVACYSQMMSLSMNIVIYSMGVYCLTKDKKFISFKKAFINPGTIGAALGMICFVFSLHNYLGESAIRAIDVIGYSSTPMCMLILGIRISQMDIKKVFTNVFAYINCLSKQVAFPLFIYVIIFFIPLDPVLKSSLFILAACPIATMLLGLAELYKKEPEYSANVVILSTILTLATIPLLSLLCEFIR